MIFEQIATGGCQSYLIGCPDGCVAALIDPEIRQIDRYRGSLAHSGLTLRYVIDTHTHADHFSAAREIGESLDVPVVAHRDSPAPYADLRLQDGDMLVVGTLKMQAIHTPGHTRDSMCLLMGDRLFTGDTLLIGATGRTDLPTGDPEALYDSLFDGILKLDPALKVFPAHDYKQKGSSTIDEELASNPRLQKRGRAEFVEMMRQLNLAAAKTPFMSLAELAARVARGREIVVLDVRERDAYAAGHVPGARHLPRGQLELRVNDELPDPTARIVTVCEFGKISTLAAATLRDLGFLRSAALDGGMKAWRESGLPLEAS